MVGDVWEEVGEAIDEAVWGDVGEVVAGLVSDWARDEGRSAAGERYGVVAGEIAACLGLELYLGETGARREHSKAVVVSGVLRR